MGVGLGLGDFVLGYFVVVAPGLVEVGVAQINVVALFVVVVMWFVHLVEGKGGQ